MKVLFYIAQHGYFWDKLVALATWGPYSHCELMFSDGVCYSAMPFEGTRFTNTIMLDPFHWTWVDIPLGEQEEDAIRKWCEGEVGCGYDYVGALRLHGTSATQWYCSEICIQALNVNAGIRLFRPCMSPNEFYNCCNCRYGKGDFFNCPRNNWCKA